MYWSVALVSATSRGNLVSPSSKMSTAMNLFGAYLIAFVKVIGLGNVSVSRLVSFSQSVKEHEILQLTLKKKGGEMLNYTNFRIYSATELFERSKLHMDGVVYLHTFRAVH